MYIRKAKAEESGEILHIYGAARAFMRAGGNLSQWSEEYPALSDIEEDLKKEQLYVCTDGENGGRILSVFAFFIGEEPNYRVIEDGAWLSDAPYGVIHRIASSEAARGTGAAKFCMDWAFSRMPNIRVDTHADNLPMQKLLKKCGYKVCGTIYVEDGSPRIAFQKTA